MKTCTHPNIVPFYGVVSAVLRTDNHVPELYLGRHRRRRPPTAAAAAAASLPQLPPPLLANRRLTQLQRPSHAIWSCSTSPQAPCRTWSACHSLPSCSASLQAAS